MCIYTHTNPDTNTVLVACLWVYLLHAPVMKIFAQNILSRILTKDLPQTTRITPVSKDLHAQRKYDRDFVIVIGGWAVCVALVCLDISYIFHLYHCINKYRG